MLAPDLPRVAVGGRALAGPELYGAAAAVADQVAGSSRVAIEASATLETVVAVVGCLLAGVVAVPVAPDAGPLERRHILRDSGAATCPPVDINARSRSSWSPPADGPALVMYTSGTTGPPKGVVLSRGAIAACLDGLRDAWAWNSSDVLAHGLPLFHVHGLVLGVLGALRVGSPLVHIGRPTPAAYAAAAEDGATLFFGVPTVWRRIAAEASCSQALRTSRLLVSGSAALPAPVFVALERAIGHGPVERYGMTETLITLAARADGSRHAGSVGGPITGVDVRLVDESGGAPEPGSIGTLHVRGATMFDGYLNQPVSPLLSGGWFDTGDAALVDRDGTYRVVGRVKDDLIKTGGHRVGAGEVEAALLAHPGVSEAAVIGLPDADLGQRIVAYVVCSGATGETLIDFVAAELAVHKRPREVRLVDALPRNAMGKVQKSRLT